MTHHKFNDYLCPHGDRSEEYTPVTTTVGATVHRPEGYEVTLGKLCLECGNDRETYEIYRARAKRRIPRSLVILGRTWWDRVNGNTYCSASVIVDGHHAFNTTREYGYGDYYEHAALELCVERGVLPEPTPYANEMSPLGWSYVENTLGINYHREVCEITRKRDL